MQGAVQKGSHPGGGQRRENQAICIRWELVVAPVHQKVKEYGAMPVGPEVKEEAMERVLQQLPGDHAAHDKANHQQRRKMIPGESLPCSMECTWQPN
jgi:hypothetical protein